MPDQAGGLPAEPIYFDVSDVIIFKNMVRQKELNGKRGVVVELVGGNKINVKLAEGGIVKSLNYAYAEISQVKESDADASQL